MWLSTGGQAGGMGAAVRSLGRVKGSGLRGARAFQVRGRAVLAGPRPVTPHGDPHVS